MEQKKKGFVKLDPNEKKRLFRRTLILQNEQGRESEQMLRVKSKDKGFLMDLERYSEGLAWMSARKAYDTGENPPVCEGTIRNLCGKGKRPKSIGSEKTLMQLAQFVGVEYPKKRV